MALLVVTAVILSVSASASFASDPVIRIIYADVNPIDTIVGQTATTFRDKVYELSNGSIIIDVRAGGVLGSEEHKMDDMIAGIGTMQMSRFSTFVFNARGARLSSLLQMPFIFESREHFWNFAHSDLAQDLLGESLELGLGMRSLFFGEEGFRHFFTRNPVTGLESFQGLQLRVPPDPITVGMVEAIGASAVVIPFTDLYTALSTGVVDGAEQPVINYEANVFNEPAPNLILNGHTMGIWQVVILESVWQSMTDNQRNAMQEAAAYTMEFVRTSSERLEQESLERLRARGVNVVDVPDKGPWIEAVSSVVEANIVGMEDIFQQIVDLN